MHKSPALIVLPSADQFLKDGTPYRRINPRTGRASAIIEYAFYKLPDGLTLEDLYNQAV